jgi:quercetin dioxygenase-like cupin family protein
MANDVDYTSPSAQYMFDINKSPLFVKDNQNFINILGKKQLNTLESTSLLDIFLSVTNVVEPHYHPNAAELIYCISGAIDVSILNPFTNQILNFSITPGKVVNVPRAWWHYEMATMNNTHVLAIFDAPNPEVVLGSNLLKFTPANVMAHTYCLNEDMWKDMIKSVQPNTYIGPYKDCDNMMSQEQPLLNQYPYNY